MGEVLILDWSYNVYVITLSLLLNWVINVSYFYCFGSRLDRCGMGNFDRFLVLCRFEISRCFKNRPFNIGCWLFLPFLILYYFLYHIPTLQICCSLWIRGYRNHNSQWNSSYPTSSYSETGNFIFLLNYMYVVVFRLCTIRSYVLAYLLECCVAYYYVLHVNPVLCTLLLNRWLVGRANKLFRLFYSTCAVRRCHLFILMVSDRVKNGWCQPHAIVSYCIVYYPC